MWPPVCRPARCLRRDRIAGGSGQVGHRTDLSLTWSAPARQTPRARQKAERQAQNPKLLPRWERTEIAMVQPLSDAQQKVKLENPSLRAPRAAAIAGIIFSVLLITSLLLLQLSVPRDPLESGGWLAGNSRTVEVALNLIPFSGIAFLWFIGVVRDRMGALEDRLFATVFLGSGLLFLALLFSSAAVAGGAPFCSTVLRRARRFAPTSTLLGAQQHTSC